MIGDPGYDRAHTERGQGPQEDWLIPPNGRPGGKTILPDDKLVKPSQRQLTAASYSSKYPMLKVAPGDYVAILYAENGHVTRPDVTTPLKPINRGTVYLYGTTQTDLSNTNLVDVHLKWTADGSGGDKKGRLLATRNFDDGQCHEVIPNVGDPEGISTYRTKFISNSDALLCQSDVQIPFDAPVGQVMSVIWVWDWPDMSVQGVAVPPASYPGNSTTNGEPFVTIPEIYTGVVDFSIVDPCDDSLGDIKGPTCNKTKASSKSAPEAQSSASKGIPAQMRNPFQVLVPQAGVGVSQATADPADIPLRPLIGKTANLQFPLPASILAAQGKGQPQGGGGGNATHTPTATTSGNSSPTTSLPVPTSQTSSGISPSIVTVTVTVPQATITVTAYETPRSGKHSATPSPSSATPSFPPTVTPFMMRKPRARRPRSRSRAGYP
jgi:hypothetical protein